MNIKKPNPAISALVVICICMLAGILATHYLFKPRQVNRATYFWATTFKLTRETDSILKSLGINALYVKIMDIDWNYVHHAYPSTVTQMDFSYTHSRRFIPVIFITNKTLQNSSLEETKELAQKMWFKTEYLLRENMNRVNEIQLDCDWTETTREKYFLLIKEFKRLLPKTAISTTIRLHQYKYPAKTGVPPADRGMLMCYNISDIKNPGTENSIFTEGEARKYFTNINKYPLPLDIALPAFSWAVVYRNGKFLSIIDELNADNIKTYGNFSQYKENMYLITNDMVFERHGRARDIYLREGDIIKIETIGAEEFSTAASLSKKAVNTSSLTVSFFSFDTSTINKIGAPAYEEVFDSFIW